MSYQSVEEAYARCNEDGIEFWKAIQLEDMDENGITEEDSWKRMKGMWQAMLTGIDAYEPDEVSGSGLVGKEGGLMETYQKKGDTLCGDYMAKVMTNALKMGCNNACMKRIVAAPTARGSADGRRLRRSAGSSGYILQGIRHPGRENDRSYVCGSRNRTDYCKPGLSCGSIRRMPGRDRFGIRHGSCGHLLYQRRNHGAAGTCLCYGVKESDGPGM